MTLSEIRDDLREIRYYYTRRSVFDGGIGNIGMNGVVDKVQQYGNAIRFATPMLYDLYIGLYVKNYTQENMADEMGFTPEYIQRLNKKLLLYFQSYFKNEEARQ